MVKLFCAIVGTEGSAFSVRVDESDSVDDLKDAIKAKKMYQFPADELQLFLAKKGNAWLTQLDVLQGVSDTKGYTQLQFTDAELRDVGLGSGKLGEVDRKERAVGKGPVNVLVVVPESLSVDSQLLQLQEALLQHTLVDSPTSTSARSHGFKASLIRTYQCDMGTYQDDMENRMLRCMLLNTALPSELVIASHLFRRKNEFLSRKLMGFDSIDDVKNGLLLFKPLKYAFDHFQISFIYGKDSNEFRLKVFDPSLRRQRLFTKLHPDQRDLLLRGQTLSKHWKKRGPRLAPGTDFNIQTTFGDVEGQPLCFMSVERPYKRCLNLQARLARKKAIKAKWIHPDEDEFEDFWSEGMSLAEKMDFFSARDSKDFSVAEPKSNDERRSRRNGAAEHRDSILDTASRINQYILS